MTTTPVWIAFSEGPLFGWVHLPASGTARAGVLLCPPLGSEHIASYASMRLLAEQLQAAGLAALRFDYRGTGDSSGGSQDAGTVQAWKESLRAAVLFIRSTGIERVVLVGLRMGATLAAMHAATEPSIDALVLWDPCVDGRVFLREQRALRLMSVTGSVIPADDGVETPGFAYGPETVADLAGVGLRNLPGRLPDKTLVLTGSSSQRSAVGACIPLRQAQWAEAPDQAEFLGVSTVLSKPPTTTMELIWRWVATTMSGPELPVNPPPSARAVVGRDPDGHELWESPVSIGPAGLFALRTGNRALDCPSCPTVVLLNLAREHHIGPGRLWVTLARRLSGRGFDVLRVDLSGIGDSPPRPSAGAFAQPTPETGRALAAGAYLPQALDDLTDVAAWVDRPVVLVGVCSGAYHAIEMGIALPAAGVCAVNPVLDLTPPEVLAGQPMDSRRKAIQPRRAWAENAKDSSLGRRVRQRLPHFAWRLIDLLGLQPAPVSGLRLLADSGADAFIVCNAHDAKAYLERGATMLRRLSRSTRFTFTVLPELDHALQNVAEQAKIGDLLFRHLTTTFAAPVATGVGQPP